MYSGWYSDGKDDVAYYLGTEDEGWRAENQWLWLENSGDTDDDFEDDDTKGESVLGCDADNDDDPCDDEGWYWFGSDGKAYHGRGQEEDQTAVTTCSTSMARCCMSGSMITM